MLKLNFDNNGSPLLPKDISNLSNRTRDEKKNIRFNLDFSNI